VPLYFRVVGVSYPCASCGLLGWVAHACHRVDTQGPVGHTPTGKERTAFLAGRAMLSYLEVGARLTVTPVFADGLFWHSALLPSLRLPANGYRQPKEHGDNQHAGSDCDIIEYVHWLALLVVRLTFVVTCHGCSSTKKTNCATEPWRISLK